MEKEIKKPTRVLEIELMKAVAIIAMVFVHVLIVSVDSLDLTRVVPNALAQIIGFFGSIPSAGVFMFAMGFGEAFSKKQPKDSFVRIIKLCILGLIVNFFQQWVPCIMDPANFGSLQENLASIIAVDIYAFAMLATLYFTAVGLIPKIRTERTGILVLISFAVIAIAFCISIIFGFETFTTGNDWLDTLIGLFIRENQWSYFPFISWIFFPITGFLSACYYQKLNNHKKFVWIALGAGFVLLLFGICMMKILGMDMRVVFLPLNMKDGLYYALHPVYAVTGLGMIAIEFVLASLILKLTKNTVPSFLLEMSKNVMDIYVVQWMLIGLISVLLVRVKNIYVNLVIALAVLAAAFFAARLIEKAKKKRKLIRDRKYDHSNNPE